MSSSLTVYLLVMPVAPVTNVFGVIIDDLLVQGLHEMQPHLCAIVTAAGKPGPHTWPQCPTRRLLSGRFPNELDITSSRFYMTNVMIV